MYKHRNFEIELDGKSYFTANVVDLQKFDESDQNWDYDMTIVFEDSDPIAPPKIVGYIYGEFDSKEELIKWLKGVIKMSICDGCILQDRCDGNCGDTNPNYYAEQEENDRYDSEQLHLCDWCENDFLEDELTDTNLGKLCDRCISAIRSRGECVEIRRL